MTPSTLITLQPQSTLEAIRLEKRRIAAERDAAVERMKESAQEIFSPTPATHNRWDLALNLFQNGVTIFKGVQLGVSVVAAIRGLLNTGRRRRR